MNTAEQQFQFSLDGVNYTMTPANATTAWQAMKNALKLANSINLNGLIGTGDKKNIDNQKVGMAVLASILSNLGDPSIKALEEIVLKHTTVQGEEKPFRLSDNPDRHFNQYRHHLPQVLIEGVKYQFGDFFKGGSELLNAMLLQAKKTA